MASQSSGSSSGTSTSDPVLPEWSQQLSSIIAALAASMNSWADGQYASGQAVTGQTIQGFLDQSGQAAGFANNLLKQYTDVFEPLINNFAAKAESWASEARRVFNMGQAESTAAQADQAGMENLKRQLEREGVNTSSGAMTEILRKSAMDDARNRTMAGTQAGMQTEQMGMQLQQIAGQMGQNVPGMWATAASVRTSALNAMEQAILGLLNTGVNLKSLPIQAYNAAAQAIKLGQQARSQQQSRQGSSSTDPLHPSNDNNNSRNRQPQQQPQPHDGSGSRGTGSSDPRFNQRGGDGAQPRSFHNQPGPQIIPVKEGPETPPVLPPGTEGPTETIWDQTGVGGMPITGPDGAALPGTNMLPPDWGEGIDQYRQPTGAGVPPGTDMTIHGPTPQIPDWLTEGTPDQTAQQQPQEQWPDQGMFGGEDKQQQTFDGSDWGQEDPFSTGSIDQSQGDPWSQPDQVSQDAWQQASDNGQSGGSMDMWGDQSPPPEQSFDDNFDMGYAKGGVIPTTGGHVPKSASPSRGKQTDDIPARLNADEYVIPKDVVRHFGTKHFDGVVAKSRKLRTGMAGAKPQAERKPALPTMGRPTFVSRYMGGR